MNCEQLAEYDEAITSKDGETEALRGRVEMLETHPGSELVLVLRLRSEVMLWRNRIGGGRLRDLEGRLRGKGEKFVTVGNTVY